MITIIHGPAGSGKTQNAIKLAKYYGATRIVDEWDGDRLSIDDGDLLLTQTVQPWVLRDPQIQVIPIAIALEELSK